ncbi:hypothetical protein, partial [Pseudomonas peli]|uniref:hypothetical protein n=1 Tax=Pseudomonas peli TaxID=592361 RepID=UPI003D316D0D
VQAIGAVAGNMVAIHNVVAASALSLIHIWTLPTTLHECRSRWAPGHQKKKKRKGDIGVQAIGAVAGNMVAIHNVV